jgi:hypothetical protein
MIKKLLNMAYLLDQKTQFQGLDINLDRFINEPYAVKKAFQIMVS